MWEQFMDDWAEAQKKMAENKDANMATKATQSLHARILSEYRMLCCHLCAHSQTSATEAPCNTCIDKHTNKYGEPWYSKSGRAFEPKDPTYFESLCWLYGMYYESFVASKRELRRIETEIKKAARESNVDMGDVKYIFTGLK